MRGGGPRVRHAISMPCNYPLCIYFASSRPHPRMEAQLRCRCGPVCLEGWAGPVCLVGLAVWTHAVLRVWLLGSILWAAAVCAPCVCLCGPRVWFGPACPHLFPQPTSSNPVFQAIWTSGLNTSIEVDDKESWMEYQPLISN